MGYLSGIFNKFKKTKNLDNIVGEKAIVIEKVNNFAGCGQVKIHGQSFSARGTEDTDVFEVGEMLHIVAIEGAKLICKK